MSTPVATWAEDLNWGPSDCKHFAASPTMSVLSYSLRAKASSKFVSGALRSLYSKYSPATVPYSSRKAVHIRREHVGFLSPCDRRVFCLEEDA